MLKIKHSPLNWLGIGIIFSVISATIAPASAQQVIINYGGISSQQPAVGSFIYGSPISTPMPVNPSTGLMPSRSTVRPNWGHNYQRTNPILINPVIRDSTLVNPVIINNSRQHTPLRGRSRVFIKHEGHRRRW
ncbi:MAG: hypothetical protein MET45_22855 [Nostoc sp. LLA-1]|nr:hypothetical protein [Cyanocohniella sp. LLY]